MSTSPVGWGVAAKASLVRAPPPRALPTTPGALLALAYAISPMGAELGPCEEKNRKSA